MGRKIPNNLHRYSTLGEVGYDSPFLKCGFGIVSVERGKVGSITV